MWKEYITFSMHTGIPSVWPIITSKMAKAFELSIRGSLISYSLISAQGRDLGVASSDGIDGCLDSWMHWSVDASNDGKGLVRSVDKGVLGVARLRSMTASLRLRFTIHSERQSMSGIGSGLMGSDDRGHVAVAQFPIFSAYPNRYGSNNSNEPCGPVSAG
jgi:hypothetical protein